MAATAAQVIARMRGWKGRLPYRQQLGVYNAAPWCFVQRGGRTLPVEAIYLGGQKVWP